MLYLQVETLKTPKKIKYFKLPRTGAMRLYAAIQNFLTPSLLMGDTKVWLSMPTLSNP